MLVSTSQHNSKCVVNQQRMSFLEIFLGIQLTFDTLRFQYMQIQHDKNKI